MPEDLELWLGKLGDCRHAPIQFEDTMTAIALEVVMVLFSRDLIQHRPSRQMHGSQAALFEEGSNIAIHGSDAEALQLTLASDRTSWGDRGRSVCSKTLLIEDRWRVLRW